jgi:hypothetical protein
VKLRDFLIEAALSAIILLALAAVVAAWWFE